MPTSAPLSVAALLERIGLDRRKVAVELNEEIVLRLLRELHRQGRTIVMVTHDPVVAARAHTVLHLEKGVLVEASKSPQAFLPGGAA